MTNEQLKQAENDFEIADKILKLNTNKENIIEKIESVLNGYEFNGVSEIYANFDADESFIRAGINHDLATSFYIGYDTEYKIAWIDIYN